MRHRPFRALVRAARRTFHRLRARGLPVVYDTRYQRGVFGVPMDPLRGERILGALEEAGLVFQAIWHDITERKGVEKTLREYREHLERLVKERTTELSRVNNNFKGTFPCERWQKPGCERATSVFAEFLKTGPSA